MLEVLQNGQIMTDRKVWDNMRVDTKWFGEIEIGEEKVITFEKGLIGFEDCKRYTIIYNTEKEKEASIMWLQSLDNAKLALPIMKPELVCETYDPIVEDELIDTLGEDIQNAELLVVVTVTVPSDLTKMTSNLKAPIIINVDTRKGIQLIADNEDYLVRFPIYDLLNEKREKEGE